MNTSRDGVQARDACAACLLHRHVQLGNFSLSLSLSLFRSSLDGISFKLRIGRWESSWLLPCIANWKYILVDFSSFSNRKIIGGWIIYSSCAHGSKLTRTTIISVLYSSFPFYSDSYGKFSRFFLLPQFSQLGNVHITSS